MCVPDISLLIWFGLQGCGIRRPDAVWHHPLRRKKYKYFIEQPTSVTGAGRWAGITREMINYIYQEKLKSIQKLQYDMTYIYIGVYLYIFNLTIDSKNIFLLCSLTRKGVCTKQTLFLFFTNLFIYSLHRNKALSNYQLTCGFVLS